MVGAERCGFWNDPTPPPDEVQGSRSHLENYFALLKNLVPSAVDTPLGFVRNHTLLIGDSPTPKGLTDFLSKLLIGVFFLAPKALRFFWSLSSL